MATSTSSGIGIKRLQHIVLQVSDIARSTRFYTEVLGFEVHRRRPNGNTFLVIPGSGNDHDLALFEKVGIEPQSKDRAGLIHSAWEVAELTDLVHARARLEAAGALILTQNHGMSLSLYGKDPDGIEFEVFWSIPEATAGENVPLDLEAELAKRGIEWPSR